jgi:hypothetical protein
LNLPLRPQNRDTRIWQEVGAAHRVREESLRVTLRSSRKSSRRKRRGMMGRKPTHLARRGETSTTADGQGTTHSSPGPSASVSSPP